MHRKIIIGFSLIRFTDRRRKAQNSGLEKVLLGHVINYKLAKSKSFIVLGPLAVSASGAGLVLPDGVGLGASASPKPNWVSSSFAAPVCIDCSRARRKFGRDVGGGGGRGGSWSE